jgi:hypothetical protein
MFKEDVYFYHLAKKKSQYYSYHLQMLWHEQARIDFASHWTANHDFSMMYAQVDNPVYLYPAEKTNVLSGM